MNKLIVFSKMFKKYSIQELGEIGKKLEVDGFDLCVRPGYAVGPENLETLPQAVKHFKSIGLDVPMVTGNFDLLTPDHPTAEPLLKAMQSAGIGLLKLGYFTINPETMNYWKEVERIRYAFEGWEKLGRKYNVKICYHTHAQRCMGLNASALAHLIKGFDPQYIGAYLDPCHLCIEGEEFALAVAIAAEYLSIIGLKDVLLKRAEVNGHGKKVIHMVMAGEGMVDWTAVFNDLARVNFKGPLSVHAEFEVPKEEDLIEYVKKEVAFFKKFLKR